MADEGYGGGGAGGFASGLAGGFGISDKIQARQQAGQELEQNNLLLQQKQQQNDRLKTAADINSNLDSLFEVASQTVKAATDAGKPAESVATAISGLAERATELAANGARAGYLDPTAPQMVQAKFAALAARPTNPDTGTDKLVNLPGDATNNFQPRPHLYNSVTKQVTPLPAPQAPATTTPASAAPSVNLTAPGTTITGVDVQDAPVPTGSPTLPKGAAAVGFTEKPVFNEDVLANVSPEVAANVKALANYDTNIKNFSSFKGKREQYISLVRQYYPDWDEKIFVKAQRAENAFSTGKQGDGVRSLNQVMGHIDTWLADVKDLQNFQTNQFGIGTLAAQKMRQWMLENQQDPRVIRVQNDGTAIANELEKAFRGSQTAIAGVESWHKGLRNDFSPQAANSAAQGLTKLLSTAVQAYGNQFNEAYRTTDGKQVKYKDPLTFFTPEARQIFDSLSSGAALGTVKSQPAPVHKIITPGGAGFTVNPD